MVNDNLTIKNALNKEFGIVPQTLNNNTKTEIDRQGDLQLQRQKIQQGKLKLAQQTVNMQPKVKKIPKKLKKSILKLQRVVGSAIPSRKTQNKLISFLKSRPNLPKVKGRKLKKGKVQIVTRPKLPSLQSLLTPKTTGKVNPLQPNVESVIFPTGTSPKFTNEIPEEDKGRKILNQRSIFFK